MNIRGILLICHKIHNSNNKTKCYVYVGSSLVSKRVQQACARLQVSLYIRSGSNSMMAVKTKFPQLCIFFCTTRCAQCSLPQHNVAQSNWLFILCACSQSGQPVNWRRNSYERRQQSVWNKAERRWVFKERRAFEKLWQKSIWPLVHTNGGVHRKEEVVNLS